jgi:hypothetical protein
MCEANASALGRRAGLLPACDETVRGGDKRVPDRLAVVSSSPPLPERKRALSAAGTSALGSLADISPESMGALPVAVRTKLSLADKRALRVGDKTTAAAPLACIGTVGVADDWPLQARSRPALVSSIGLPVACSETVPVGDIARISASPA